QVGVVRENTVVVTGRDSYAVDVDDARVVIGRAGDDIRSARVGVAINVLGHVLPGIADDRDGGADVAVVGMVGEILSPAAVGTDHRSAGVAGIANEYLPALPQFGRVDPDPHLHPLGSLGAEGVERGTPQKVVRSIEANAVTGRTRPGVGAAAD